MENLTKSITYNLGSCGNFANSGKAHYAVERVIENMTGDFGNMDEAQIEDAIYTAIEDQISSDAIKNHVDANMTLGIAPK